MNSRSVALLLGLALTACSAASFHRVAGDAYELDDSSRASTEACHPELLRVYRGQRVRLEPPITVAVPFEAPVARFEELVAEVATRVYGRAPTRILNAGAYACRAVEHRQERLSEHALGNAVDVTGFRFPALTAPQTAGGAGAGAPELPKALQRAFTITVARDYPGPSSSAKVPPEHHRFFRELAEALRQSSTFRGMLGPADPRHATHLHLDMAPWPYERL